MIKSTTDVVLIPLMGTGNVACVCLAFIVMNTRTINLAPMLFTETIPITEHKEDYDP